MRHLSDFAWMSFCFKHCNSCVQAGYRFEHFLLKEFKPHRHIFYLLFCVAHHIPPTINIPKRSPNKNQNPEINTVKSSSKSRHSFHFGIRSLMPAPKNLHTCKAAPFSSHFQTHQLSCTGDVSGHVCKIKTLPRFQSYYSTHSTVPFDPDSFGRMSYISD